MQNINPNNWHYTVDSGLHKGDVVVPLADLNKGMILCSVQFSKSVTTHVGDHTNIKAELLTRLNDADFGKYHLRPNNSKAA